MHSCRYAKSVSTTHVCQCSHTGIAAGLLPLYGLTKQELQQTHYVFALFGDFLGFARFWAKMAFATNHVRCLLDRARLEVDGCVPFMCEPVRSTCVGVLDAHTSLPSKICHGKLQASRWIAQRKPVIPGFFEEAT